jgi:hypothetical protein
MLTCLGGFNVSRRRNELVALTGSVITLVNARRQFRAARVGELRILSVEAAALARSSDTALHDDSIA